MMLLTCTRHFAAILAMSALGSTFAAPSYDLKLVDIPVGNPGSTAPTHSVDNQGRVTGSGLNQDGAFRGFFTRQNGDEAGAVPTLGGTQGRVVGRDSNGHLFGDAKVQGDTQNHLFLTQPDGKTLHDLGTLGGPNAYAAAVSDGGILVGVASADLFDVQVPVFASPDTGYELRPMSVPAGNSGPTNVNDNGIATGYTFPFTPKSVCWISNLAEGTYTTLLMPTGASCFAYDINDQNRVVGYYQMPDGTSHAFATADDGHTTTDVGLNSNRSVAKAINKKGQIVGSYVDLKRGNSHAFLTQWPDLKIKKLDELVDLPAGVSLTSAQAISANGRIVAVGSDSRTYLLTPR